LELISWVSRSSLDTEDTLNWFFTKNRITKAICNVGELLILSPLNIEMASLIMVVMVSMRAVGERCLMVDLLSLREPSAGRLSPSMVMLKEHVIEVAVLVTS
jgi:hypothetical protein